MQISRNIVKGPKSNN